MLPWHSVWKVCIVQPRYSPIRAFFLLSSCSAEMKPRIEIFMLKLDCGENLVMFGHSGHKLQRFEDLVFTIHLYGI